jgi:hypothetical protein
MDSTQRPSRLDQRQINLLKNKDWHSFITVFNEVFNPGMSVNLGKVNVITKKKINNETLLERRLKLYRPLSAITDPRSLVPDFSFSFPVHWQAFREACWDLLQRPHASDALARFDTESWAQDNGKKNSLDELELSRS